MKNYAWLATSLMALSGFLSAAPSGPVVLKTLEERATDILVGVQVEASGGVLTAKVERVLKGIAQPGETIKVNLPSSIYLPANVQDPRILFVVRNSGGLSILSQSLVSFAGLDGPFLLAASTVEDQKKLVGGTSSLARVVAEFGAGLIRSNTLRESYLMMIPGMLWGAPTELVDPVRRLLLAMPDSRHRAVGYLLGAQAGDLDDLKKFEGDPALTASEMAVINLSFALYWKVPSSAAIQFFGRLSTKSDRVAARFAVQALRRFHVKECLPYFASLLDALDVEVRYQAVAGLAEFANGFWQKAVGSDVASRIGLPAGGTLWSSDSTTENFPTLDDFIRRPETFTSFWKAWWNTNQAQILKSLL